jgi:hypothetical protein
VRAKEETKRRNHLEKRTNKSSVIRVPSLDEKFEGKILVSYLSSIGVNRGRDKRKKKCTVVMTTFLFSEDFLPQFSSQRIAQSTVFFLFKGKRFILHADP